jgi:hypothetical protein
MVYDSPRDTHRAMTVCIRLQHRHDRDLRPDNPAQSLDVSANRRKVDFEPRGTIRSRDPYYMKGSLLPDEMILRL